MERSERLRLKQMAVDAIVQYPYNHPIVAFAEALEKLVNEAGEADSKPHCATCNCGDVHET